MLYNYRFEIFYKCAVIMTLQSAKTTLLAWHYFGREETKSDTFGQTSYINCCRFITLFMYLIYLFILGYQIFGGVKVSTKGNIDKFFQYKNK